MRYIVIIWMLFSVQLCLGQENYLRNAINAYQSGDLNSAKENIELAVNNEGFSQNPQTWYVRGFIYKDLYKADKITDSVFQIRELSANSFEQLLSMEGSEQFHNDALVNLKFLAVSFYNDAVLLLASDKIDRSAEGFDLFKYNLKLSKDTTISVKDQESTYYLNLATKYGTLHKNDTSGTLKYFEKAIESYQYILELDSNHLKANYNLAVLYYNEAVKVINELEYDEVDIFAFSEVEDRSIDYFKASLPFMERAFQLDKLNVSAIEGLSGIYFGLREFDKSDYYKQLGESLKNE